MEMYGDDVTFTSENDSVNNCGESGWFILIILRINEKVNSVLNKVLECCSPDNSKIWVFFIKIIFGKTLYSNPNWLKILPLVIPNNSYICEKGLRLTCLR